MEKKAKLQFGVWMDSRQATIVGRGNEGMGDFEVLGHVKAAYVGSNSSEHTGNNLEQKVQAKFFKEITNYMQNAHEIHITGNGISQEQFRSYLAETPQFKNTKATDDTGDKMTDDKLIAFFSERFK